jgi:hypothetical protein
LKKQSGKFYQGTKKERLLLTAGVPGIVHAILPTAVNQSSAIYRTFTTRLAVAQVHPEHDGQPVQWVLASVVFEKHTFPMFILVPTTGAGDQKDRRRPERWSKSPNKTTKQSTIEGRRGKFWEI